MSDLESLVESLHSSQLCSSFESDRFEHSRDVRFDL